MGRSQKRKGSSLRFSNYWQYPHLKAEKHPEGKRSQTPLSLANRELFEPDHSRLSLVARWDGDTLLAMSTKQQTLSWLAELPDESPVWRELHEDARLLRDIAAAEEDVRNGRERPLAEIPNQTNSHALHPRR
ncbi:hypothetical protein SAMN02745166_00988 [Prosthecobacter debontii]|uniref:Uncharacterized protein n=1 Tax=Prosthecobacter debontii TaxID=48467 RepID=A0A1T4X564_9BACT|nr:hypothetical protein SAMN02745166_00988 [Prosthecobacter debontii]